MAEGDEVLKGTSRMWLWDPENMSPAMLADFATVAALNLRTSKAWQVKENFAMCWEQPDQARGLIAAGHTADDKLAILIRNRPEYMEATFAAFKGRFVHVNVNYRYKAEELSYIFDNSDARVVVYGSEFAPNFSAVDFTPIRTSSCLS